MFFFGLKFRLIRLEKIFFRFMILITRHLSPPQRLQGFFLRRESAEKVSAGVKVGTHFAHPSHSGNLLTPHQTSAEGPAEERDSTPYNVISKALLAF